MRWVWNGFSVELQRGAQRWHPDARTGRGPRPPASAVAGFFSAPRGAGVFNRVSDGRCETHFRPELHACVPRRRLAALDSGLVRASQHLHITIAQRCIESHHGLRTARPHPPRFPSLAGDAQCRADAADKQWSRLLSHASLTPGASRKDAAARDPAKRLHRFEREYGRLLVRPTPSPRASPPFSVPPPPPLSPPPPRRRP